MTNRPATVFISAAEASGDAHAAALMRALRRRLGDVRFMGVAGQMMAAEGCEVLADLTKKASMMLGPVARLGYYVRTIRRLQRQIMQIRPDVHVPVDSPAMNWHLAAAARASGSPVMYYIAPQVWAWAPWRVRKLSRLTDEVLCILPFEERYLRDRGVNARYVGHPLFDRLPARPASLPDLAEAWSEGKWRVALLPGSRPSEVKSHTPALLAVAAAIRRRWPGSRCTISALTDAAAEGVARSAGTRLDSNLNVAVGKTWDVLAESHFAVAVSGTVTLEVAHFGVPMIVFYRVGRLRYKIFERWLRQTPLLSLVNILAGQRIVPELIPWYGRSRELASLVMETMDDLGYLFDARQDLIDVTESLRIAPPQTACDNAAERIARVLERRGR